MLTENNRCGGAIGPPQDDATLLSTFKEAATAAVATLHRVKMATTKRINTEHRQIEFSSEIRESSRKALNQSKLGLCSTEKCPQRENTFRILFECSARALYTAHYEYSLGLAQICRQCFQQNIEISHEKKLLANSEQSIEFTEDSGVFWQFFSNFLVNWAKVVLK